MSSSVFNISEVTSFYLSGYYGMEKTKEAYFFLFLLIYFIIVVENAILIGIVYCNKSLHEPMYLLMCNLAVNGLFGGTALLPGILTTLLSHSKEISLPLCRTQLFAIHTYAITEFTILAVMSYDRYLAICFPLTYPSIMPQRVIKLIILTWIYPIVGFLTVFSSTLQLKFCKKTIEKLYCLNYLLVQLSCSDSTVENILGLLSVVLFTVPQIIMIVYSYIQILRICIKSFNKSKLKALRTCVPHLLAVLNYSIGCFFEIVNGRVKNSFFSYHTTLFFALYFSIFPPILNPVIYGFSMQVIRVKLIQSFRKKSKKVQV